MYKYIIVFITVFIVPCVHLQILSQCGSAYAFSAIAALEGASALATGNFASLSEQNIIDCSGNS